MTVIIAMVATACLLLAPTPEPPPVQSAVPVAPPEWDYVSSGVMSEADWDRAFAESEYPPELQAQTKTVALCESRWRPAALNPNGPYRGLMQLAELWFRFADQPLAEWADPVVNLRATLATIGYDRARGYADFAQWECKP